MKAVLEMKDQKGSFYEYVEAGEYALTLLPETEDEAKLAIRLHKSIDGIKELPQGAASAYFHAIRLQYGKPEISFRVVVSIKSEMSHYR